MENSVCYRDGILNFCDFSFQYLSVNCYTPWILFMLFSLLRSDVYRLQDEVLGKGAHTIVQTCVSTRKEYAVKVSSLG